MGKKIFFFVNILQKYLSLFEELSHRSPAFAKIIQDAERDIREIL
jgi:phosphoserine aminotransferase